MPLPITSATAAALALLLLLTAILTVRKRLQLKAAFGDADDDGLIAASRSHGNLAEHAPIVLIMARSLAKALKTELDALADLPADTLIRQREERFLQIGA